MEVDDCKEPYIAPEIKRLGTVVDLTTQGGGAFVDVPEGTDADVPGGITGS